MAQQQMPGANPQGTLPVPTTVTPQPPTAAPSPPAPPSMQPTPPNMTAAPGDKKSDTKTGDAVAEQKIVNNPFAPGGVVSGGQVVTRKELVALMEAQEARLRKELAGQAMSPDELAKLVSNAATPVASNKPDNFMGCVNGVPMYRLNDGTLELGTKDPEIIRKERCGDK